MEIKIMKKKIIIILVLIFACLYANSTGIEFATMELIPISVNENNDILLKIKVNIDPQDAGATKLLKFGFLVINESGLWDEIYYFSEETKDIGSLNWDLIKKINENHNNNMFYNLDVFREITTKYGFVEIVSNYIFDDKLVDLDEYDNRFLSRGYNNNMRVKSLEGYSSLLPSSEATLYFKFNNIYLVRNRRNFYNLESTGAEFILPNYWITEEGKMNNLGYTMNIDGIVFCK